MDSQIRKTVSERFFIQARRRTTETPRLKRAEVLVAPPTLLPCSKARKALVVGAQDFRADALWRGSNPRFGAGIAPHSHVVAGTPSRLAGAALHPPSVPGRWREKGLAALLLERP